ncbi:MAG TPA: hypothetical protein VMU10_04175 [Desulfomonilia bacterium]|nr:hypothetical protein [Desulfomonilia bacterium]
MGKQGESLKFCSMCFDRQAITECDGCLRPLCKKCRNIEIWRTTGDEVTIKSFCPDCRDNPQVNPLGKGSKVFGLGQVTDIVNQGQHKVGKFKIKMKI